MMKDTFAIKLDLTMMAEKLHGHIAHRAEEIDGLVNKTIQTYCADGTIERVVDAEVRKILDEAIKESIDNYFKYSKGKDHIRKRVETALDEVIK